MGVIKDVAKVFAIVGTVVSALNLNDYQAKTLKDYAKMRKLKQTNGLQKEKTRVKLSQCSEVRVMKSSGKF